MFNLILYFMFLIINCDGFSESEVQVIHVSYTRPNEAFRVMKEKPLKIIFEDDVSVLKECRSFYWNPNNKHPFTLSTEFRKPTNNYIVVKVINDMSTKWKCSILQEYHGPTATVYNNKTFTSMDLLFHIHVTMAKEVVLIVNDASLTVVPTNETADHDAEAHYKYEDGENIEYKCHLINYDPTQDELRLEYYDAQGRSIFKTTSSQTRSETFRSLLKLEHNNYYLDCICTTFDPKREYRYRVYFYFRNQDLDPYKHPLTLYVNGERQLLRREQLETSYDDYIPYKYIDGEQLNVTCKKNREFEGNIRVYFKNNNYANFEGQSEITLPSETVKHNINQSLICNIGNMHVQNRSARIDFKSALPELGVRIIGLPRKNIMYRYTNDSKWTIAYQFSVNETLNLTCVTKSEVSISDHTFLWKFEDETLTSTPKMMLSTVLVTNTSYVKVLNERHNQTHIRCIYQRQNETAVVVLHLKPEIDSEISIDELAGQERGSEKYLIIIIAVAVIILSAVATIFSMFWIKRKKHARLIENAYEDQSQNESPIPAFPRQWENEYAYCTTLGAGPSQETHSYATIIDKFNTRESNAPSEHHYTEIDDYFKTKINGKNATYNSGNPTAGPSVNGLEIGKLKEVNYQNVGKPFKLTYENTYLNQDLPNNSKSSISRTYCNVPRKNKVVSFQENKPTQAEVRIQNDLNPFRNNINTGGHKQNNSNVSMQKDTNYENLTKEKRVENPVYAEPHSDFDEMVINTLYGKI
ncbi:uncharacterized protein LOC124643742 [Helicoverpa zea]|uniref:uncharacterized protein LOC124643742 n=1 Tax=Helicoverpa zea TaxID=7113 RepID=UPI001F57B501|nr:uncharacterized protein LOC124643742 [Helicoverpa zea]